MVSPSQLTELPFSIIRSGEFPYWLLKIFLHFFFVSHTCVYFRVFENIHYLCMYVHTPHAEIKPPGLIFYLLAAEINSEWVHDVPVLYSALKVNGRR